MISKRLLPAWHQTVCFLPLLNGRSLLTPVRPDFLSTKELCFLVKPPPNSPPLDFNFCSFKLPRLPHPPYTYKNTTSTPPPPQPILFNNVYWIRLFFKDEQLPQSNVDFSKCHRIRQKHTFNIFVEDRCYSVWLTDLHWCFSITKELLDTEKWDVIYLTTQYTKTCTWKVDEHTLHTTNSFLYFIYKTFWEEEK